MGPLRYSEVMSVNGILRLEIRERFILILNRTLKLGHILNEHAVYIEHLSTYLVLNSRSS